MAQLLVSLLSAASNAWAASSGSWSDPVEVSLSPAAAYVMPDSGNILMWSSGDPELFGLDKQYQQTYAAVFDPTAGSVSDFVVTAAHTDMFCPGISLGADGTLVVVGGSTSQATSVHNINTDQTNFYAGPNLNVPRGYQAQATLSDGGMFTIGGSWSGGRGGKVGEVLDPSHKQWQKLPGCKVEPMLTRDREGAFRSDNHAWLFGWKNRAVFQAGPSKNMNWYYPAGQGSSAGAGVRDQTDAMCGTAAMYDAPAGKILTAGGSPWYNDSAGLSNAAILTLTDSQSPAQVQSIPGLNYPRTLHNSVILPDGTVMIVGGQSFSHIFSDANATTIPELWNPNTNQFTPLADQKIARTYHSWALLLQDGRVLSGGGGLCRRGFCEDPSYEHNDVQILTPPYLLPANEGDSPVSPPVIQSAPSKVRLGSTIAVTVATPLQTPAFALMRLGSATHTVNTDQRRVPLAITQTKKNVYSLAIPKDAGVVLPGYYFLFALSNGVPSVSKIVQITTQGHFGTFYIFGALFV